MKLKAKIIMRLDKFKALLLCFLVLCCIGAKKENVEIYCKKQVGRDVLSRLSGEWISIKDYAMPIAGLDDEEINKLMDINCRFENDLCIILRDTIHKPNYTLKSINASQYFLDNYPNITKSFVGIKKDIIDVVSVNAENITETYDIIDNNGKILIFLDGVFFQYQRPESLEKSNPILVKEVDFQGNKATLEDPLNVVDSLRGIANSLSHNKLLIVVVQGNTDNSDNNGLEKKTTIDNKGGSIKDLLIARAQIVSQLLITQLKVNPNQIRTSVGKVSYRRSATLMLFRR